MNAEELYQIMKEALHVLDVPWGDKEKVKVEIDADKLRFSYKNRTYEWRLK